MSFFATTDAGNIINRFSQDIQMIDAQLPIALLNTAANAFVCLAQAIMIIPVSYWLVLAYPFLFGALYAVQKYYLRTSRQLRFLDLEAKSPIYSQFLETLGGLATIRAFSWEDDFIRLNEERLDWSQKPFYLLSMIQRWLNLVLDLIAAALAIILTAVAISLRETVSPGFTGVALYNIMTLSSAMKAAINVWTVLETSVGAVARVRSFAEETANENLPGESHAPPDNWPEKGSISIENVTAAYMYVSICLLVAFVYVSDANNGVTGRMDPLCSTKQHYPSMQEKRLESVAEVEVVKALLYWRSSA